MTIADHSVTHATLPTAVSSGSLAKLLMLTTARDTPTKCSDYQRNLINLQLNSMKLTSNTTKATLQPYSPEELREIAENVRQYRVRSVRHYAYTNDKGQCIMYEAHMGTGATVRKEQLHEIEKDLYIRGTHQPQESSSFTLKVIGTTLC